jgi:hypothetical protein
MPATHNAGETPALHSLFSIFYLFFAYRKLLICSYMAGWMFHIFKKHPGMKAGVLSGGVRI